MHTAESVSASTLATAAPAVATDDLRARSIVKFTGGTLSVLAHAFLLTAFWYGSSSTDASLLGLFMSQDLEGRELVRERHAAVESLAMTLAEVTQDAPMARKGSSLPEIAQLTTATGLPLPTPTASVMPMPTLAAEVDELIALAPTESLIESRPPVHMVEAKPEPRTVEVSPAQKTMLEQRLMQGMRSLDDAAPSRIIWSEDGRSYTAMLIREPTTDSMGLERVIAEITASSQDGSTLRTQLSMQRLAFSQFTQVVDQWDADVQLHDDEIIGRFHSNSPVNVAYEGRTAPRFLGKVTTAGRGFRVTAGRPAGRNTLSKLFQGGLETNAGRIEFPSLAREFAGVPMDDATQLFTFSADAHITFLRDGSYAWRGEDATTSQHVRYSSDRPLYLVGARDVVLYVKGTVSGQVLVYCPGDIVIEGNLRYAHDPRTNGSSSDYLGLVADHDVEIARPRVIGPGDLEIDAAIFAGRRFSVTHIEYDRPAKLSIYGSLTTRTLSATEPRFATRIEFDPRFDQRRPPGFPSTNRYEVADWQGMWKEVEEDAASSQPMSAVSNER